MKIKRSYYIYPIFFLVSLLLLLFFSDDSSPLTSNYYESDSSLFMLFGKAIKDGYTIYKDLFDHKGPYLFFIQYICQIICEGKTGVFIIQIINTFSCMFIIDKIYCINNIEDSLINRLAFQIPFIWTLAATLDAGNTNEEFCLPFLLLCLYWTLKYLNVVKERDFKHKPIIALLYGMFFGVISLIRINNSAFICAAILSIVIILIINKEYINLLRNAYMFIIGFALSVIPMLMYYYSKGALVDMLYSTFVFAFRYSTEESTLLQRFIDYFTSINIVFFILSLLPIYILVVSKKTKTYDFMFAIITSISTFATTFIGLGFLHYFMLTIPSMIYGIYLLYENINVIKKQIKNYIVVVILVILLLGELYNIGMNFAKSAIHIIDYNLTYKMENYYDYITEESIDIVNHIPKEEQNSVWGYEIYSRFYLRTGIYPSYKYYDYLNLYFGMKTCDIKDEIINYLNNNNVKWLILPKKEVDIPKEINKIVESNYLKAYENTEYILYNIQ